ncbi:transmembrane adaptor Erv26-domain-containing protein [Entophlyctis helioformis]|nr:transmembrane adaptor Erv26-domain-containing protein [Entophlyctis helioformis]
MGSQIAFTLLTWTGLVLGLVFVTLCLACGLYFMAEFVEEHTVLTKRIIKYTTYTIGAVHVLMAFEGFPLARVGFSGACLAIYSLMLPSFPSIQVTSPSFIVSCILVISNHFAWFFYFTTRRHTFNEIASFFGLLVWLVPFLYFVSLSANDYTLPFDTKQRGSPLAGPPGMGSRSASGSSLAPDVGERYASSSMASAVYKKRGGGNIIKSIAQFLSSKKEALIPTSSKFV